MNKLEEKVIELVSLTLGIEKEQITRNSSFFADLNADKLALAELYFKIQETFQIKLPAESLEKLETVDDLIRLIEEYSDELF